ncbi:MAG: starvation-inducible DNA-binding protein [bacterium]
MSFLIVFYDANIKTINLIYSVFRSFLAKFVKIKNMKTNILGLPVKETEVIVNELNSLLSNYQVYYQNLRGIHWNIRGKRFFDLHVKFEELYNDSQLKVDMIAERVLTLGGTPLHTFEDYIKYNNIVVGKNISNDEKAVQLIVDSLSHLLALEREILNKSAAVNDEGSNAMMSDFIAEQEKTIWMMMAWLEE